MKADLDRAIELAEKAVSLMPDGRNNQPELLNNLGTHLFQKHLLTGDTTDLDQSIIYVSLDVKKLLEMDPPPPYKPKAPVQDLNYLETIVDVLSLSFTPIVELHALTSPIFNELLRPRLRGSYSRIEWTCVSVIYLLEDYANLDRIAEISYTVTTSRGAQTLYRHLQIN